MIRKIALLSTLLTAFALHAQIPWQVTERYLLPIFTPPVHGAFGSEFHTSLYVTNRANTPVTMVFANAGCIICIQTPGMGAIAVPANGDLGPATFEYNGNPGRFVYVMTQATSPLSMNLRVHDVTRDDRSFGVEIPVVSDSEFFAERIVLTGIPTDARFRNTLRIYSESADTVTLTIQGREPVLVPLTSNIGDPLDPKYAMYTDFPVDAGVIHITIDAPPLPPGPPLIPSPIWAFVTVTNNETQVISTITPQP